MDEMDVRIHTLRKILKITETEHSFVHLKLRILCCCQWWLQKKAVSNVSTVFSYILFYMFSVVLG